MLHELRDRPSAARLHVTLDPGDALRVDGAAIERLSDGVVVGRALEGGPVAAIDRRLRGGTARLRRLTAARPGQAVVLGPRGSGDVEHVPLDGEVVVDRASLLAVAGDVTLRPERAGVGRVLAGGAPVRLRCRGRGDLWLRSPDPIHRIDVDGTWCLHGAHLLAHDAGLCPVVHVLGGPRSLVLSGEGRVVELVGRGRLWYRTRVRSR